MKTSTANVRKCRQRQREGLAVLQIVVNLVDHTEMLISAGFLGAGDDPDKSAVEEATAKLLRTLVEESLPT